MEEKDRVGKINELREEMRALEGRLRRELKKSDEAFNLGGDGWHDNSAYHLMMAEIDKIGAMLDEIKVELKELTK